MSVPRWLGLIRSVLAAPAVGHRPHPRSVGDRKVVGHHLHPAARRPHEGHEAVRVVLGQRVLDRDDRIAPEPAEQQLDHAVRVQLAPLEAEPVAPAPAQLRGRHVERDRHLLARE